jgi:nitrogen regulatory protein P-II 1
MKLLVLVLNDEEKLDEILLCLLNAGVKGATVIDSVGMVKVLGIKIPFFRKIQDYVQIHKPDNKTIFTVIYDDKFLKKVVDMIKNMLNFEKPGTGFMFVVPVLEVYGTTEVENKDQG